MNLRPGSSFSQAFILGSGELHVDMGSILSLVCIIEKVIWQMINVDEVCGKKANFLSIFFFAMFSL